tara:strand:+ start:6605 stop:7717 length:1113 start_codon:yes stop_codon:yes gene_type:complete
MKKTFLSILAIAAIAFSNCTTSSIEPTMGFQVDPTNFKGTITQGTVSLDASVEYNLTGALIIENTAKLIIPAGTVIKASGGTSAYIAVAQGGKIYVDGTATNPVVMTSSKANPAAGDWGGFVICGKAPTNKGITATAEVSDLTYGGTVSNDSSGSIRYLRVEYTGATYNASKEFNGVSLFAVGSGTTFEYVQSYNGGDDGLEFFGGSVNAKYIVSVNSGDDSVDFADGFTGSIENVYIKGVNKAGFEGSNNGDDGNATPVTTTTIKNATIIRGGLPAAEGTIYYKEGGGKITYQNLYVDGLSLGVKIKSTDTAVNTRIKAGDLIVNPIQFVNKPTGFDYGVPSVITELNNTGAGSGAAVPSWAAGWTVGL